MKIVTLKDIDLISSTIPEDRYHGVATADGEWSVGSYDVGDVVYYSGATPHKVYQSIASSNTATPGTDVTKWTELGATDRWAIFDEYLNTQSYDPAFFSVSVDAADCDYAGVFNCDATSITFSLYDGGSLITSDEINLDASNPMDYDEWFFWPSDYRRKAVWSFPQYSSATTILTVTFTNTLGVARCGAMGVGKAYEIGGTLYDPEIGFNDYSYKYENETTGAVKFIKGNYSDVGTFKVWLLNRRVDMAMRRLIDNRGKMAIYDFNNTGVTEEYESFVFYGFPSRPRITVQGPSMSRLNFVIRGMI